MVYIGLMVYQVASFVVNSTTLYFTLLHLRKIRVVTKTLGAQGVSQFYYTYYTFLQLVDFFINIYTIPFTYFLLLFFIYLSVVGVVE